jgi:hypothetical protein
MKARATKEETGRNIRNDEYLKWYDKTENIDFKMKYTN